MTIGQTITGGVGVFVFIAMVVGGQEWLDHRHASAEDVKAAVDALQGQIIEIRKDNLRRDRVEKRKEIREIRYHAEHAKRALTAAETREIDKIMEEIEHTNEKIKGLDKK